MQMLRETRLIYLRAMTINLHNPFWVIIGLLQPIVYLLLFAPLLEGMGLGANAYNVFVPGLLVLNAMFGSLFVGFGLLQELGEGVIERMRVTPISRLSMLLGRVFRDITTFLFQSLILVLLAIPFGLDVNIGGAMLTFVLMILIGLVLAPLSYSIALGVKTLDGFAGFINMFSLPLMLLSGILLPITTATAPGWLVAIAKVNPFYYAVEGARAVFVGDFGNSNLWIGIGLMLLLAVLLLFTGARAFGRAVR